MLRVLECPGDGRRDFREIGPEDLSALRARAGPEAFMWIDAYDAAGDELAALADVFQLHPLLMEDLEQRDQRQKAEPFADALLVVAHVPMRTMPADGGGPFTFDEIDVVVGEHWLVTSHDRVKDLSAATAAVVAARPDLRENGGMAAVTALLDRLVDRYERVADELGGEVEEQDRALLDAGGADPLPVLRRTAELRQAVLQLRRKTGQLRELVGVLVRHELAAPGHTDALDLELRDVYDHAVRAQEDLEILYERLAGLADTRLALTAFRQNEITKKLSAWGAILLVPTVVTGWFGMNFTHLSFLGWRSGEFLALAVVLGACVGLFLQLRRSGWL